MTAADRRADDGLSVFVVDDDADVRDGLGFLLRVHGYRALSFASAEAFLDALQTHFAGCLVIDIRMPGMNGLALQQELCARGSALPVVVITAHGDIESARQALRARAVDFLTKPFEQQDLLAAIRQAFDIERKRLDHDRADAEFRARISRLTAREREVAALLATGANNLSIARLLEISPRTVENHKARCMEKLGAGSVVELARIADRAGLQVRPPAKEN